MNTESLLTGSQVLLIVAFIGWRQFAPRRVRGNLLRVPLILTGIGLLQLVHFAQLTAVPTDRWAGLLLGLACAALIAIPRAATVHLWRTADGTWLRRGGVGTLAWWLAAFAAHAATTLLLPRLLGAGAMPVEAAGGFGSASLLIYLGVSLGVQAYFLERRLEALDPGTRRLFGARLATVATPGVRTRREPVVAPSGAQDVVRGEARW